jgi:hypothetical protein
MSNTVTVTIKGNSIKVSPDPLPVANNSDVEWVGDDGTEFTIVFPHGGGSVKSSGKNGSGKHFCSSDKFSNTTPTVKTVKYTVVSGSTELDPDLEIQPGP